MCECLTYADGDMYLCEVCGPMYQEDKDELAALRVRVEAADRMEEAIWLALECSRQEGAEYLCGKCGDRLEEAASAYRSTAPKGPRWGWRSTKRQPKKETDDVRMDEEA